MGKGRRLHISFQPGKKGFFCQNGRNAIKKPEKVTALVYGKHQSPDEAHLPRQKMMTHFRIFLILIMLSGLFACRKPGLHLPFDEPTSVQGTGIIPDSLQYLVYINPHKMPVFPDGEIAFMQFATRYVRYTPACSEIIGLTVFSFMVEPDGSTSNLKILKLPHPCLEPMIREMFAAMPCWTPGELNGKPVRTRMVCPIRLCAR